MLTHFSSLCPFSGSSFSSIKSIPLVLRRARHCFLLSILSVCVIIPGHWGTVTRVGREGRIVPRGTADIFKGRAHTRITKLGNCIIPGHYIVIPGH